MDMEQTSALFGHLAHGDGSAFFERVADDVDWTVEGTHPLAGHYRSKQAFREGTFDKLGKVLPDGAELAVQNILTHHDWAVVELRSNATARDGLRFDNRYCWVCRFAADEIVEVRHISTAGSLANCSGATRSEFRPITITIMAGNMRMGDRCMLYEIATLGGSVFASKDALPGARAWLNDAKTGTLLGIWHTDIGRVGELLVLRRFEDEAALQAERRRTLLSEDPFASTSAKVRLTMESYALFPFLTDPAPRTYGGTFEFRTYHLRPGGLPGTMAGWKAAIAPAHHYTDHLVAALYALDGAPRISHIWGFQSIEERNRLRREHYAVGLWPPTGGPERIAYATSTIALAEPGLPIC